MKIFKKCLMACLVAGFVFVMLSGCATGVMFRAEEEEGQPPPIETGGGGIEPIPIADVSEIVKLLAKSSTAVVLNELGYDVPLNQANPDISKMLLNKMAVSSSESYGCAFGGTAVVNLKKEEASNADIGIILANGTIEFVACGFSKTAVANGIVYFHMMLALPTGLDEVGISESGFNSLGGVVITTADGQSMTLWNFVVQGGSYSPTTGFVIRVGSARLGTLKCSIGIAGGLSCGPDVVIENKYCGKVVLEGENTIDMSCTPGAAGNYECYYKTSERWGIGVEGMCASTPEGGGCCIVGEANLFICDSIGMECKNDGQPLTYTIKDPVTKEIRIVNTGLFCVNNHIQIAPSKCTNNDDCFGGAWCNANQICTCFDESKISQETSCNDGADNNGNGYTDCADLGCCVFIPSCAERDAGCKEFANEFKDQLAPLATCGIDADSDGDMCDKSQDPNLSEDCYKCPPDCGVCGGGGVCGNLICEPGEVGEFGTCPLDCPPLQICGNWICEGNSNHESWMWCWDCYRQMPHESNCSNGIDDDQDATTDCDDNDCISEPHCWISNCGNGRHESPAESEYPQTYCPFDSCGNCGGEQACGDGICTAREARPSWCDEDCGPDPSNPLPIFYGCPAVDTTGPVQGDSGECQNNLCNLDCSAQYGYPNTCGIDANGDGHMCDQGEYYFTCPQDCCGTPRGTENPPENPAISYYNPEHPEWCYDPNQPKCRNHLCENRICTVTRNAQGMNDVNCTYTGYETTDNCPQDCTPPAYLNIANDGTCEWWFGEDPNNSPNDCLIGNDVCEGGEMGPPDCGCDNDNQCEVLRGEAADNCADCCNNDGICQPDREGPEICLQDQSCTGCSDCTCNNDHICDTDQGEVALYCPHDCRQYVNEQQSDENPYPSNISVSFEGLCGDGVCGNYICPAREVCADDNGMPLDTGSGFTQCDESGNCPLNDYPCIGEPCSPDIITVCDNDENIECLPSCNEGPEIPEGPCPPYSNPQRCPDETVGGECHDKPVGGAPYCSGGVDMVEFYNNQWQSRTGVLVQCIPENSVNCTADCKAGVGGETPACDANGKVNLGEESLPCEVLGYGACSLGKCGPPACPIAQDIGMPFPLYWTCDTATNFGPGSCEAAAEGSTCDNDVGSPTNGCCVMPLTCDENGDVFLFTDPDMGDMRVPCEALGYGSCPQGGGVCGPPACPVMGSIEIGEGSSMTVYWTCGLVDIYTDGQGTCADVVAGSVCDEGVDSPTNGCCVIRPACNADGQVFLFTCEALGYDACPEGGGICGVPICPVASSIDVGDNNVIPLYWTCGLAEIYPGGDGTCGGVVPGSMCDTNSCCSKIPCGAPDDSCTADIDCCEGLTCNQTTFLCEGG